MDDRTSVQAPPYSATQSLPMQYTGPNDIVPDHAMPQQDAYHQGQPALHSPTQYPHQPISPPSQPYTGSAANVGAEALQPKQEYFAPTGVQYGQQEQQQYPQQGQQQFVPVQAQANQYQNAMPLQSLDHKNHPVDCPVCHHRQMTRTEKHSGNTTNALAALLCLCFCLGCIPYIIPWAKDTEHFCGDCGVMLATYKASGRTVVHKRA